MLVVIVIVLGFLELVHIIKPTIGKALRWRGYVVSVIKLPGQQCCIKLLNSTRYSSFHRVTLLLVQKQFVGPIQNEVHVPFDC